MLIFEELIGIDVSCAKNMQKIETKIKRDCFHDNRILQLVVASLVVIALKY